SLGLLTINALAAADELLVPIQCEYYALEGLGQLLRNVRLIQQNVNSKLRLTGIVMTMYDARTKLSDQVVAEVRRYFGSRGYDSAIHPGADIPPDLPHDPARRSEEHTAALKSRL